MPLKIWAKHWRALGLCRCVPSVESMEGRSTVDNRSGSEQRHPCIPSSVAQPCSCQWFLIGFVVLLCSDLLHQHTLWHKMNEFEVEGSIDMSFVISLGSEGGVHITLEWIRLSSTLDCSWGSEVFYGGAIISLC